ncbi:unnamed protein product [Euphydryas editha]|uniref:Uncharacterized protein n=1 Tax=Euphydryas editha TaxID=104508 RepID=A0AAU9TX20_EUPED|nr:unnamed protein product [Euphydryas editha]
MTSNNLLKFLIPGCPTIPGYDSGLGNGRAGGAKNPRVIFRYHQRRYLAMLTHSIRILRSDEKILKLEEEISKLQLYCVYL